MAWKTVEDNGITLQFPAGGTDSLRVVFDTQGHDIAYVVPDARDNGNSNALVIASAPELLSACKLVWDAVNDSQFELPNEILLAAFKCRRAFVSAVTGIQHPWNDEQFRVDRRREQNRAAQQRCRVRKKSAKGATDGTHAG